MRALLPPLSCEEVVASTGGLEQTLAAGLFCIHEYGKEAGHPFDVPDGLGGALGSLYLGPCFWAIPRPGPIYIYWVLVSGRCPDQAL